MKRIGLFASIAVVLFNSLSDAQGAADSLFLQGMDQRTLVDVRSRGMGGAAVASGTNASVLFVNPAGLTQVGSLEVRVAGSGLKTSQRQTQEWVPNRLYTGLSLMMEDKWGDIKSPTDPNGNPITDPWEQLQKPFDTIGPNWARKTNQVLPLSVAVAVPVTIENMPFVFGIGGSRAIDLDHFFQNNNVTDPLLGQYRPQPIPELTQGDTLRVRWYQFTRKRTGAVWGVTPAVGVSISGVSLGASATYYTGTSDDLEQRVDRGFLTFSYNRFRVQDTVKYVGVRSGTSTYTGLGGAVGLRYEQPHFALAATVQFPYTLKRKYSSSFSSREDILISTTPDSTQTTIINTSNSGTDKVHFPLSYALGLLLKPSPKWTLAFDYDVRGLNRVEHTLQNGAVDRPWVGGSSFRLGAEYLWTDWLAIRGGYREVPQAFSPEGAALIGDPAVTSVYCVGAGVNLYGVQVDAAYEYARLRYQDSWQSNVNYNTLSQHRILLEFGYHPFKNLEEQ